MNINFIKRNNVIRYLCRTCIFILSVFAGFIFITGCRSVKADAYSKSSGQKTIKIGYIDYSGFFEQKLDGTFEGYGVDYLHEISKYTGWNYEYLYGTFSNQLKNLKDGKIDLICHAQTTKDRKKNFIFSKYSDGEEASILYTSLDDERYYYNDYKHFNGMRIAFLKDSFQNKEFAEYAKDKGFSYKAKYYNTSTECFEAIDNKEVDGAAMGSLAMQSDYKVVCRFGSTPFYFMSGKMNKDIIEKIDSAQIQIKADNPYFETELYKKYYGESAVNNQIRFTREEAKFVKKCGVINIGVIPNRKPFSYINDDGKIDGIIVDIMKLISQRTKLKFNFVMTDTGQTSEDFLKKNPDSFLAGVLVSNPQFKDSHYIVSDSMYNDDVVLACNSGTQYDIDASDGTYTLAIPKSYVALKRFIYNNSPEFNVITAKTTQDCIKLVQAGKADFMAQNKNVITPLLSDPHYEGLTVLPTFFMQENLGVVCNNTEKNRTLINIFDKCADTFTEDEISQFTVNHTIKNGYKASFGDFVYKFRYALIVVCVLLMLICFLVAVTFNIKRHNYAIILRKNEQLADAVNHAESASNSKSQFLARVSHEIRTPMNAIVGLTEIARHHKDDPVKVEEYLSKIDISSKVLLNIINDVLDMSAIESAKLKIANEPFDIHDILSSISNMYYIQCRQKNIEFNMNTSNINHEILIGDGLRVNQILLNLISNAFKFTPEGGRIYIEVQEASYKSGRAYINFYVKDTGEGMSEEMQKRLFQPFEQEEVVTARKHGGSGLGLSIAKNLVEMMHGSISCKSKKNVGTAFLVSIPFEVYENNNKNEDKHIEALKALIVDNDKDTSDSTAVILNRLGVPYNVASDEKMAMELLARAKEIGSKFDICFIDWKDGRMREADITRKIREKYDSNSLVIVASAYDTSEIENDALEAGADMLISKPLFQSSVFDLLMKMSGGAFVSKNRNGSKYDFEGKTILLAEDTEFNADIAIELLDMVNMKAVLAKDGEEAVKLFNESEPGTYEAILMDIQMPVMDGYEATRRIRASSHPDAGSIQIYAMTANAFAEDISKAINSGMNGHISKPIDTEILYGILEKVVENNKIQSSKI